VRRPHKPHGSGMDLWGSLIVRCVMGNQPGSRNFQVPKDRGVPHAIQHRQKTGAALLAYPGKSRISRALRTERFTSERASVGTTWGKRRWSVKCAAFLRSNRRGGLGRQGKPAWT
jgi:hypothetical protein